MSWIMVKRGITSLAHLTSSIFDAISFSLSIVKPATKQWSQFSRSYDFPYIIIENVQPFQLYPISLCSSGWIRTTDQRLMSPLLIIIS